MRFIHHPVFSRDDSAKIQKFWIAQGKKRQILRKSVTNFLLLWKSITNFAATNLPRFPQEQRA